MHPSFTRKFFSLFILGCSLLIAFFSISYLSLTAAVPTATLGEFTIYLERMLGVSPLTGLESGQVVDSTRLNNQPVNYYQRLIGNCAVGYILSVNTDGSVVCGSPIVPPLPPPFTCAARPAYANVSFFDGTPAIANMPWTQIGPNCKYTCTGGYSGVDCSVASVGNSCAALPACTTYGGCTTTIGAPTSIGQLWTQIGPNCKYTCNAGFTGPTCAPVGASSCMSYNESWTGSGQSGSGNCSALIPAGFTINDNQPIGTSPTITLMNTVAGYSGSVTWKCVDSDPVIGTTAVEWIFNGGSCTAIPYCSSTLPTCDGVGCTTNLGTPTSIAQTWSRDASGCGFSCNAGYSGIDCEIPPSGGNCGTFSCFAHKQAGGYDVACWNNFKSALTAWTASGYITPAQRTQIESDGLVSWNASCQQLAGARATLGGFYRNSILTSLPVTGVFTLDTEEFALFGGCSVDAQVACPALPPSAPTLLTGVAGNASVALSWTAPTGIVADYIIEYKTTLSAIWLVFADGVSTGTTANVTGLTNGTSYDFRVKARNGNGDSGPSNVVSATPTNGVGACKDAPSGWTADQCVGYPYGNAELVMVNTDGLPGYDVYWQSNVPGQGAAIYNNCSGRNVYYKTPAEMAAMPDCSLPADSCGPTQTTGSMEYPIDASACTSGAQTDVDINGFDNAYNWKCGALSCSATVLPHCEGQRGTSADAVTWDYTDIFLLPGNTSIRYNIGAKFRASCTGRGGATCTDIDPSPVWNKFQCSLGNSCGPTASILPSYPSPDSGVPNPPTTQLCSDGSAPSVTSTTSLFSWTCGAASCSVPRDCILKYRANIFALWQEDGMSLGSIRDMSSALIVDISSDPRIAMIPFGPGINRYSCGIVPSNSCAPAPACIGLGQCAQTANAPTSVGQAWTLAGAQCGYTCNPGWSGANCDTAVSCFDARQYSVGRHCDIGGGYSWWDQRSASRDNTPFLFGRVGFTGIWGYDGEWHVTDSLDNVLCKNGASPIQSGDYGYSCPPGSIANGGGCYYPNTDPRRPTECDGADPGDECCFFVCPATLACTGGTCGSANGTTVTPYPSGAQLCTSGNIQNIDNIAADGIYNWGCGSTSCSANRNNTIGPFCNGIAKPIVNGGAGPKCVGGTKRCETGNASWICGGGGWVWSVQNHLCVGANQGCP